MTDVTTDLTGRLFRDNHDRLLHGVHMQSQVAQRVVGLCNRNL